MDSSIWIALIGAISAIIAAVVAIVPALIKKPSSPPKPDETRNRYTASENHPVSYDDLSKFTAAAMLHEKVGDTINVAIHKNEE